MIRMSLRAQENDGLTPSYASPAAVQNKIRLLIVDDHPIVRFGLTALLGVQDDIEIAGAAQGGREALQLLENIPVDIILLDLRMPGFSGIQTLEKLQTVAPKVRTIVLSSFECDEEIYAAVKAEARGYLHKEAPAEEIVRAIRSVHEGRLAFPRRITERLSSDEMTAGLSDRERQVLELVAKGLTNKEVANTLQISQFTVRNHLNHITEKLEVSDRTEAIFIAIQTGIITV
jgi:two-component system NarL family response regulator